MQQNPSVPVRHEVVEAFLKTNSFHSDASELSMTSICSFTPDPNKANSNSTACSIWIILSVRKSDGSLRATLTNSVNLKRPLTMKSAHDETLDGRCILRDNQFMLDVLLSNSGSTASSAGWMKLSTLTGKARERNKGTTVPLYGDFFTTANSKDQAAKHKFTKAVLHSTGRFAILNMELNSINRTWVLDLSPVVDLLLEKVAVYLIQPTKVLKSAEPTSIWNVLTSPNVVEQFDKLTLPDPQEIVGLRGFPLSHISFSRIADPVGIKEDCHFDAPLMSQSYYLKTIYQKSISAQSRAVNSSVLSTATPAPFVSGIIGTVSGDLYELRMAWNWIEDPLCHHDGVILYLQEMKMQSQTKQNPLKKTSHSNSEWQRLKNNLPSNVASEATRWVEVVPMSRISVLLETHPGSNFIVADASTNDFSSKPSASHETIRRCTSDSTNDIRSKDKLQEQEKMDTIWAKQRPVTDNKREEDGFLWNTFASSISKTGGSIWSDVNRLLTEGSRSGEGRGLNGLSETSHTTEPMPQGYELLRLRSYHYLSSDVLVLLIVLPTFVLLTVSTPSPLVSTSSATLPRHGQRTVDNMFESVGALAGGLSAISGIRSDRQDRHVNSLRRKSTAVTVLGYLPSEPESNHTIVMSGGWTDATLSAPIDGNSDPSYPMALWAAQNRTDADRVSAAEGGGRALITLCTKGGILLFYSLSEGEIISLADRFPNTLRDTQGPGESQQQLTSTPSLVRLPRTERARKCGAFAVSVDGALIVRLKYDVPSLSVECLKEMNSKKTEEVTSKMMSPSACSIAVVAKSRGLKRTMITHPWQEPASDQSRVLNWDQFCDIFNVEILEDRQITHDGNDIASTDSLLWKASNLQSGPGDHRSLERTSMAPNYPIHSLVTTSFAWGILTESFGAFFLSWLTGESSIVSSSKSRSAVYCSPSAHTEPFVTERIPLLLHKKTKWFTIQPQPITGSDDPYDPAETFLCGHQCVLDGHGRQVGASEPGV